MKNYISYKNVNIQMCLARKNELMSKAAWANNKTAWDLCANPTIKLQCGLYCMGRTAGLGRNKGKGEGRCMGQHGPAQLFERAERPAGPSWLVCLDALRCWPLLFVLPPPPARPSLAPILLPSWAACLHLQDCMRAKEK